MVELARGPLQSIDWSSVYSKLRMGSEFERQSGKLLRERWIDTGIWQVLTVESVTLECVLKAHKDLGDRVYVQLDLGQMATENVRDIVDGSYSVAFKRSIVPDQVHANKSAAMLAAEGVNGITLLEYLLLALGYRLNTGKHLDWKTTTLCSGSRNVRGYVPGVSWNTSRRTLEVCLYQTNIHDPLLGTRAVVL